MCERIEITPDEKARMQAQRDRVIDVAVRAALEPITHLLSLYGYDAWSVHEAAVRRAKAALERESGAA